MKRWLPMTLAVVPLLALALPARAGADERLADLQFSNQSRAITLTIPTQNCRTDRSHVSSCNWELFVNEPGEPGQPVVGTDSGTSGVLSVPYPADFCGVVQADVMFGTPLHKVVGRRRVVGTCGCPSPGQPVWPSVVTGASHVRPLSRQGIYLNVVGDLWTMWATHDSRSTVVFSGTITTDGTFSAVTGLKLENHDRFSQTAPNQIEFNFINHGFLDGLSFAATCGSHVTVDASIDGSPVSPSQIFLGPGRVPASSSPVTFTRVS